MKLVFWEYLGMTDERMIPCAFFRPSNNTFKLDIEECSCLFGYSLAFCDSCAFYIADTQFNPEEAIEVYKGMDKLTGEGLSMQEAFEIVVKKAGYNGI